jgi:hypothetical protein
MQNSQVRLTMAAVVALLVGVLAAVPASGDPGEPDPPVLPGQPGSCDEPNCVPGIQPGVILGTLCDRTDYYVFGTTSYGPAVALPGRIVFCGSPRRYAPRWYRAPKLVGVKEEGTDCGPFLHMVAQAPDGLFLYCLASNGRTLWVRGDA